VDTSGGFVAPEQTAQEMPSFSLYGDGLAITHGAQPAIYPGPVLPSLIATPISTEGVHTLVSDALDAGLGTDHRYTSMTISDMPTTTFTLSVGGATHTTTVYGLGDGTANASGMNAAERNARAALARFAAELADVRHALPSGSVGAERQYVPEAVRVFVQPYSDPTGQPLREPAVAWPLSSPLGSFGTRTSSGIRCGSVTGPDLQRLLDAARSANQLTPWTSAGARYSLALRALLPDEHGC